MRFLKDGPSIPDELLVARDRGEVVFVCGAGVSKAFAGLPDFLKLATSVADRLGDRQDSPARRLIAEIPKVDDRVGVRGIVSADQVFGLFERDFSPSDIGEAVRECLEIPDDVDLRAHEILLRLSKSNLGKVQLVTTNFDLLFEKAGCEKSWEPPLLPNPLDEGWLDGIVYLHGRMGPNDRGAHDKFVLSSSTFGRAYLADGWATRFLKDVLEHFVVVFVGYGADDPPVRYLLEALRSRDRKNGIYVFHPGRDDGEESKWGQRGVCEISYSPEENHRRLWDTLERWATRADDVHGWYEETAILSQRAPSLLQPFERGQVAHLVSTEKGAQLFAGLVTPSPSDWLCTFDPRCRFAEPQRIYEKFQYVDTVDLIQRFGLDAECRAPAQNPRNVHSSGGQAEIWSAFDSDIEAKSQSSSSRVSRFRTSRDGEESPLSNRLDSLARWIGRVANQPATLWWAKKQRNVHIRLRHCIENEVRIHAKEMPADLFESWQRVFESWRHAHVDSSLEVHQFVDSIRQREWTESDSRRFVECMSPRLRIDQLSVRGTIPPGTQSGEGAGVHSDFTVEYPRLHDRLEVPDDQLALVTRLLRFQLERAVILESQLGGHAMLLLDAIGGESSDYSDSRSLPSFLRLFMSLLERLSLSDPSALKQEVRQWPNEDSGLFFRLSLWWHGSFQTHSAHSLYRLIQKVDDRLFWLPSARSELLRALKARWTQFSDKSRERLIVRLLSGPQVDSLDFEKRELERAAWDVLSCVTWLERNGCAMGPKWVARKKELSLRVEDWQDEFADSADSGNRTHGGVVSEDTDHQLLLQLPLGDVLEVAGRKRSPDDFLLEYFPFKGLCIDRPARALIILGMAAKKGSFPQQFWRTFLSQENRKSDSARMKQAIIGRLLTFPAVNISLSVVDILYWLKMVLPSLGTVHCEQVDDLILHMIQNFDAHDEYSDQMLSRAVRDPEWGHVAHHGRVGQLVDILFMDDRVCRKQHGDRLEEGWVRLAGALLGRQGQVGLMALSAFAIRCSFLYSRDCEWVKENLLCRKPSFDADHELALWIGLLAGSGDITKDLYGRLKPRVLSLIDTEEPTSREFVGRLSRFLLIGWISKDEGGQLMEDAELRQALANSDESVRVAALNWLWQWAAREGETQGVGWKGAMPRLFSDVWPKQKKLRSSRTTLGLVTLALDGRCNSKDLLEAILPHLVALKNEYLDLHFLRSDEGYNVLESDPGLLLDLLSRVLDGERGDWPHDLDRCLSRIRELDPSLAQDRRYVRLLGD